MLLIWFFFLSPYLVELGYESFEDKITLNFSIVKICVFTLKVN